MERPGDLAFWGWEDHLSDSGAGRTISVTAGPGREYPARPSARSVSYFRMCLDLTEGG